MEEILKDISLEVPRGSFVGVIGPNGCGKSTLLKTLVGKIGKLGGELEFGHNVNIGYFDQQIALSDSDKTVLDDFSEEFPDLTITELRNSLAAFMFYGKNNLKSIQFDHVDTSNVSDMSSMFAGCLNLQTLDLSSFETSNVVDMNRMFSSCISLENLDLSSFNTSKVENMNYMFSSCSSLKTLDLSNFITKNCLTFANMFSSCSNLEILDLSSFETLNSANLSSMFYGCNLVKEAYAKNEEEANKFNSTSFKPSNVNFVVKEIVEEEITVSDQYSQEKERSYRPQRPSHSGDH